MTEAEKLFNQIFTAWLNRQAFITSFRRTSLEGMNAAKENIQKQVAEFTNEMLKGHDYDEIFLDRKEFFRTIPPEKMIHDMTQQDVRNALERLR